MERQPTGLIASSSAVLFSPQKWFCNCCGKEMNTPPCHSMRAAYKYRVCGLECYEEMCWKDTLSIMGKEYYPRTEKTNG